MREHSRSKEFLQPTRQIRIATYLLSSEMTIAIRVMYSGNRMGHMTACLGGAFWRWHADYATL
jgi:hypothetical protein